MGIFGFTFQPEIADVGIPPLVDVFLAVSEGDASQFCVK
jgi:hypothetical protein